ncbi:DHH phosphoesterase [Sarocladium strictum]
MKRSAPKASKSSPAKKPRIKLPEYHEAQMRQSERGEDIWPAPQAQLDGARDFILKCVAAQKKTLIVPDKDADGLSSGAILKKSLMLLGLSEDLIHVHLLNKGTSIHDEGERKAMTSLAPSYIFVLDQGSRNSPPVIDGTHEALIIDHHFASETDFPEGSSHVTACDSPPVATTSLLTYLICSDLHEDVAKTCDWLCVVGTHGDLGNTLKWEHPFPDMAATFKLHKKSTLTRAQVNAEVERCTHTAPKFSSDGRIAVFKISSPAQVHPVIATRWAGHLQSSKLEVILVANEGYLPGMVNFSCRIPRCARNRDSPVNIIETLQALADKAKDSTLRERLGHSFARGHKEASGGIVPINEFEEFIEILEIGRMTKKTESSPSKPKQSNTLANYFKKA